MRALLSYILFSLSLLTLISPALAHDAPPPEECHCSEADFIPLFAIESELKSRCEEAHGGCKIEALECRIHALRQMKEECLLPEHEFRHRIRDVELELAYTFGYRDGKEDGVCKPGDNEEGSEEGEGDTDPDSDHEDDAEEDSDNDHLEICHIPPGNPENAHTISVSVNAIPAHAAHGDTLGACEDSSTEDNLATDTQEKNTKKKKGKKKKKKRKNKR